jgi:hypothetical protein
MKGREGGREEGREGGREGGRDTGMCVLIKEDRHGAQH